MLEVSGSAHEFDLMIMNTSLEDPAGNRLGAAELLADGAGPFEGTSIIAVTSIFMVRSLATALAAPAGQIKTLDG